MTFWIFFIEKSSLKLEEGNHEIELVLKTVGVDILSKLYNYDKKTVCSYFEIVTNKKEKEDSYNKLRKRININNFNQYNVSNRKMLEELDNNWEEKITLTQKNITDKKNVLYIIKDAIEKEKRLISVSYFQKKVKIYFIMSISIIVQCITVTFKIKKYLKNSNMDSPSLIYNFFNHIINHNNTIEKQKNDFDITLEFEYNGRFSDSIDYVRESLIKSICFTFGVPNINNFRIILNNVKLNIFTNMIYPYDLFGVNESNILITSKIDGELVYFKVEDTICYLIVENYLYILKSNITNKHISFSGIGEYLKIGNIKCVFPFYFDNINKKKMHRLESIVEYNRILSENNNNSNIIYSESNNFFNYDQNMMMEIVFKKKDIFDPFSSKEEYMQNIVTCIEFPFEFPSDGIILIESSGILDNKNDIIIDKKYKFDNTIDVLTRITVYRGVYKNTNNIEFKLFKFKNNTPSEITTLNIQINDNLYFDSDLTALI